MFASFEMLQSLIVVLHYHLSPLLNKPHIGQITIYLHLPFYCKKQLDRGPCLYLNFALMKKMQSL